MSEVFERVRKAFEGRSIHGSDAVCGAIGRLFETGHFDAGYAMAKHTVDMHQDDDPFSVVDSSWTEIYLEAFRRTYFDIQTACKYGTDFLARNRQLVETVALELIAEAESHGLVDPPLQVDALPANVTLFPAAKTRQ